MKKTLSTIALAGTFALGCAEEPSRNKIEISPEEPLRYLQSYSFDKFGDYAVEKNYGSVSVSNGDYDGDGDIDIALFFETNTKTGYLKIIENKMPQKGK